MDRAMIVSLGGSPQPVIVAIRHYEPAFVCFVASEQSVEMVPQVRQQAGVGFRDRKAMVSDANDLLACYGAALQAAELVEKEGYAPEQVVVDYTGGTKSMTAALVLATVARGYAFSYVGGDERSKNGLGQVLDGHERLLEVLNPWEVLAVQEQTRLAWLFNHFQWAAAADLLATVRAKARHDARLGRLFACLDDLVAGYAAWDRFAHRKARGLLHQGAQGVRDCAVFLAGTRLETFVAEVDASLAFFNRLHAASADFRRLCPELVTDLIANAERRAEEGKYDDGVARLYRALEMAAQVALAARKPPLQTGALRLEQVPPPLRDEFVRRYGGPASETLKLPLYAAYQLLDALGDPAGRRFTAAEAGLQKLLFARNGSILAHGLAPLNRESYEGLLAGLLEVLGLARADLPRFPRLELGLFLHSASA